MARRVLKQVEFVPNWTSLIGALEGVLRALGERPSTAYLMGITGHAFRLTIVETPEGVAGPSGPFLIAFDRALALYHAGTGYRFERLSFDHAAQDYNRRVEDLRKRIMRSIDAGMPVIAFDLFLAEYGLIYGYDDRDRVWIVDTMMTAQVGRTLPWDRWPTTSPGRYDVLFLKKRERPAPTAARAALAFAVSYAEAGEGLPEGTEQAYQGLAAYERWARAFEAGEALHPFGNAYNAHILRAARGNAARFLAELAEQYPDPPAADLKAAAQAYRQQTLTLSRLTTLFPYPQGGDPTHPAIRAEAARYLRSALAQERTAVQHLKQSLPFL